MFDIRGMFDNAEFPWLHRAGTDSENMLLSALIGVILFVNIV